MGFTQKEINESLSENKYDEVCATYMLLQRDMMVRAWQGVVSIGSSCVQ